MSKAACVPFRLKLEELARVLIKGDDTHRVGARVNQYGFTRALAGHVLDHWQGVLKVDGGLGDKHSYDPRAWGRAGEEAMAARVRQACEQLGSARHTLTKVGAA